MKIPVSFGGGGSGSDDCTAKASQVLSPYTAITSESDDEPIYGTMKDYAGTTQSGTSSLDTSNSRLRLAVPNEGRYTTASYIYQTYSNVASLISLTAAKIATGNTILGVSGTYTGLGSATQAQVLSGKTFSTASLSNASGTMTDKSGTTTSATASLDTSNSRLRLAIPTTGYYNTSAYLYQTYSNIASLIGLTAAKVVTGNTILGISGSAKEWTYTSGSVSVSSSPTTTRWYYSSSGSHSFGSFSISNIGFTPMYVMGTVPGGAVIASSSGANVICSYNAASDYTDYYSASYNSSYSFTSSSIKIPLYNYGSGTFSYTIVGYN